MRLPALRGVIRRRILVNFRVDPEVMSRHMPLPFQPKLHHGMAIAGICLIRLEQVRPAWLPAFCGFSSENAAHRVAARWQADDGSAQDGVFISRRDTGSLLAHLAGGRIFPGEHHMARFAVQDDGMNVCMSIRSRDDQMKLNLLAKAAPSLPPTSCFKSLEESSAFFEAGRIGYSVTQDCSRFNGVALDVDSWCVHALDVEHVSSSYFDDEELFPKGSVTFDHALVMRDIQHVWTGLPDVVNEPPELGAVEPLPA